MSNMLTNTIKIENRDIGENHPTYFIADIAANHDGDLQKAIDLIYEAKEAGADVAKFQHFKAETIVSDHGFKSLGKQQSHQAQWKKSVFDIYREASLNEKWTPILKSTCEKAGITFFTSPYSLEITDEVDPFVSAYKIGSGDITWLELVEHIASKQKPILIACGASSAEDVDRVVKTILNVNPALALMQCNTNYTGSLENFRFVNLNVIKSFRLKYPNLVLGLSDHTPGHATVLGAVALGARIVEKHFTLNNESDGPDHLFSLNPVHWREMVDRTRELEFALGDGIKRVEENESQTVILQRRSVRAAKDLPKGTVLTLDKLSCLRPCPAGSIQPYEISNLIGKIINKDMSQGENILWNDITN